MKTVAVLTPDLSAVAELREIPEGLQCRPGRVLDVVFDPPPGQVKGKRAQQAPPVIEGSIVRVGWVLVDEYPPGVPVMLSALAFTDRITPDEWERFYQLGELVPEIRHALRRLDRAQEVDLRDPALPLLLGAAAQAGALAPERIAEILALP